MTFRKYSFWILGAVTLLTACTKAVFDPIVKLGNAPQITSPADGSSFVLTEDIAADTFATVEWTAADFGFQAAVTYEVQLDKAGNDFSNPILLGTTSGLSLPLVVEKVNNQLLTRNIPGEVATDFQLRIVATVHDSVPALISETIALTITPYTVQIDYPKLQVPGSYQGWDPANEETVIWSVNADERYEGYIYFPEDNVEFKYTKGPSWTTNWGDNGADGTLEPDGANIVAGPAGQYKLNVDLNTLTHSFVRTDWGLIGSATPNGWDSDMDMTFDPATNVWSITTDLSSGEIKFRANDDWAINLGDNDADTYLEYDGANIVIEEAGNYTIELMLRMPRYRYKITKN
ncbi:MAG: SusF/SusE family outer membrane protein [Bacteroidetes bacterium]|nr:MAG: SusF/SusE family outer membrane protein [Bacteroidota bacterium]